MLCGGILAQFIRPAHMFFEDVLALFIGRHVDGKQSVKPTASEKFRRKAAAIVGCCEDETGVCVLLHPGQQPSKHPLKSPSILMGG